MKLCEYCGKEIDYNHAFCSDECEDNTFIYHKYRKKFQNFFSIISVICFIVIMLGTFIGLISQILKVGLLVAGPGALLMGIVYIILPYYGIEEQIHNKGIITGRKTMRIIGAVVSVIGVICIISGIIVPFA